MAVIEAGEMVQEGVLDEGGAVASISSAGDGWWEGGDAHCVHESV